MPDAVDVSPPDRRTPAPSPATVARLIADADGAATDAGRRLWQRLGLRSDPPAWSASDREAAHVAIRGALEDASGAHAGERVRTVLLRLTAVRWSGLVADELVAADEELWRHVLAERYERVRRCCAPRTAWRTGTLSALLAREAATRQALQRRIARWMLESWDLDELPAALEAAFVQGRVPSRSA